MIAILCKFLCDNKLVLASFLNLFLILFSIGSITKKTIKLIIGDTATIKNGKYNFNFSLSIDIKFNMKNTTIFTINNLFILFVNTRDSKDLADKMIELVKNKENLQEMGDKSFELCKEKFTIDIIDEKMMSIMEVK